MLLEFRLKVTRDGVEEGEGMEKTGYPGIETWVWERFREEMRTLVALETKPGTTITVQVHRGVEEGGEKG